MVDVNALHAEIVRNGLTKQDVAKAIGIWPETFYRKMRTGDFTVKEAAALIKYLKIKKPAEIFFAKELP